MAQIAVIAEAVAARPPVVAGRRDVGWTAGCAPCPAAPRASAGLTTGIRVRHQVRPWRETRRVDVDDEAAAPAGTVYDWYQRGLSLLRSGSAEAAAAVLAHAHRAEPASANIREAFARALFDSRRYDAAEELFRAAAAEDPTDHYAHFGLGLALSRRGRHEQALSPLALAVAMCPENAHYTTALAQARATVRARQDSASS
jgi:tetratricopeptide (TPR) repeat protein